MANVDTCRVHISNVVWTSKWRKSAFSIGVTNDMVDRGLMDKNNMDNLGFADLKDKDKNNDPNKK